MRLRKNTALKTRSLILGGLLATFVSPAAIPLVAQQVPVKPNDVRKILNQPATASGGAPQTQSKPAPVSTTPKVSLKPATPAPAPAPTVKQTSAGQAPVKPAVKPAAPGRSAIAPAPASAPKNTAKTEAPAAAPKVASEKAGGAELKPVADHPSGPRRDPFDPLLTKEKAGPAPENLPPGKAGLQITTLRLDGIVRAPSGMLAVVSNPQQRVYFLRDGDHLYDGEVEHITMDGLSFHQTGTDPFGKPVEREVTKRLYPTPGDVK